jgi:hypothetical protein
MEVSVLIGEWEISLGNAAHNVSKQIIKKQLRDKSDHIYNKIIKCIIF